MKELNLLPFFLFIEQYFTELEQNLVASQAIAKQQPMVECFKALMQNVERSLNGKNRDRCSYHVLVVFLTLRPVVQKWVNLILG